MNNSKELIIDQFKSGDVKAYENMFKHYYSALCLFAMKHLHSEEQSEEIVQDLFCKLWENREDMEITVSLKSYLYGAVRLNCLRYLKTKELHRSHHKIMMIENSEAVDDNHIERNELQANILKAISELPEQRRKIFELSRFEQLKYKEIAEKLSLSPKTVENQMGKALKFLREHLKDHLPTIVFIIYLFSREG
ncbi:MAG: RNA polymerase sigma-70 factor [Hyphomicrobiales bacterium]